MTRRRLSRTAVAAVIALSACRISQHDASGVVESASGDVTIRGATPNRTAPPVGDSTSPAPWTVSFAGAGPVRIGMSSAQAASALGIALPSRTGAARASCDYRRIATGPLAGVVAIMLVRDTVARVDVDSASVATQWGDRVGDTEPAVLARHAGRVRVLPGRYTGPTGHDLVVDERGGTLHRLVLETDGAHVTTLRTGRRPEVEWVERCS